MPIIESVGLSYTYHRGTPLAKKALENISLSIGEGEFISIIGATGSGKSTLIQHFNGLLAPQQGALKVLGQDCHQARVRTELWRQVGLVFQYPDHQLFEETVSREIAYGLNNLGIPPKKIKRLVLDAINSVGLDEALLNDSPLALSGGQKRKVALASIITMQPKILILDEPTAGIEPLAREKLLNQLKDMQRRTRTTVLMITHSLEEAAIADRLLVLHQGKLVLDDCPQQIFAQKDLLESVGLAVPVEVEVLHRLRQLGVSVPVDVVGVPQAVEHIIKAYQRGAKGG